MLAAEVFKPTEGKGDAEKNDGEGKVNQIKLYPQSGIMVICDRGLSDKEIKEKERTRKDQISGRSDWRLRKQSGIRG